MKTETEPNVLRAMDAQVAQRVMQWRNVEPDCYTPIGKEWCGDDPEGTGGFNRTGRKIIPHYSKSTNAAVEVEDRIAELGLQNDYIAHLWDEVGAKREGSNFWTAQNFNAFWLCVHATPEQRCRAAIRAVECLSISDHPDDGPAS